MPKDALTGITTSKMTRDDYKEDVLSLSDDHKFLMLNFPTGFGKTRLCLDVVRRHYEDKLMGCNILIVVPKLVLIDTWKDEMEKWDFPQHINVVFTTYISYPKHADQYWDAIIFDEAHHYTETCATATDLMHYDRVLAVSGTIPKEPKWRLKGSFRGIFEYVVSAREAIDEGILPDPKVLLIPMTLDNTTINQEYVVRKSKPGTPINLFYQQRNMRFRYPTKRVNIKCTQQQYYNMVCEEIDYKQRDYQQTQQAFKKNLWLQACKQRLDWMTTLKEDFVLRLLASLDKYRTLTFCTYIAQTKKLCDTPIHSEDKKLAMQNLADFNEGKINHIATASMLNEGVNLTNCQIGIYANIGASKVIEVQRLGRLLRHKNPLIIIPFFLATREEELVNEMLKNYNQNLVVKKFKSEVNKKVLEEIINGEVENQQSDN